MLLLVGAQPATTPFLLRVVLLLLRPSVECSALSEPALKFPLDVLGRGSSDRRSLLPVPVAALAAEPAEDEDGWSEGGLYDDDDSRYR